ncbi:toprim domain-containing protein [Priestia megaterium]|uniref:toprim domain-containing protein n=1 Tax=Priestia megaterium TaxID=1404 RepID=UPI00112B4989|nr:toprim domain-containing protein [Priestia megaterium]TPF18101.1 DNA topoisomerase [Priestia megaterium]TPF22208.1 DNA topoisomerase [Priestia megaterium]
MSNGYGNDSIRSLSDREAVRMRVATYAGGNDKHGAFTTAREILSNSTDEFKAGHGNEITIQYFKDSSIKVSDKARGCPVDWNEAEGKYNYELIYLSLNAGGKYSQDSYEYALGLNGIGSALTILSSEFAFVEVIRDGYKYNLEFKKGELVGEMKKEQVSDDVQTGTSIHWRPDLEVFLENNFPEEWFTEYLEQQAIVNKGLKFIFINQTEEYQEFYYENGIIDYLNKINENKNFTEIVYFESEATGKDRDDKPEYRSKYQIAFCFNNEINALESYHNSSFLKHGGSPHNAIKNAFTYAIDQLIKSKGKYTKNEKKISFDHISDSLVIVTNTYSTETSYQNQTKFAITNKFIQDYLTKYLKDQLEIYFIENPLEADKIVEQVLINKHSSEKAEKTRLDVKKKLQGTVNNLTGRIDGFVNCRSKDVTKRQLTLVEGKSALGSTKQGRDAEIQAIYALRGKILNCLKADYDKIFKNDIIVDLLKLLGCGVEIKSKHNKDLNNFDINNLKWKEINIVVDSDIDGGHILTLLLTMFYRLTPTLIREGRINVIESPLYEIVHNDKSYFAHSDAKKDSIVKELGNNVVIQRSKGLGENTPEMMWETTMNPLTRKQYTVTEDELQEKYFDLFLGDNLTDRKGYIEDHLHEYLEEALD